MNRSIFFLLSLVLFGFGCDSDDDEVSCDKETIIFGHFFGECSGERCVEIYMLQELSLFEASNEFFDTSDFDFDELSNDLYAQVEDIRIFFPRELINTSSQTYGCPDCADQGGIYVQLVDRGGREFFIDQDVSEIPEFLRDFAGVINERIALLP